MFDYKCDPGTLVGLNLKRNQTGLFSLSIFLLIFFFFFFNKSVTCLVYKKSESWEKGCVSQGLGWYP